MIANSFKMISAALVFTAIAFSSAQAEITTTTSNGVTTVAATTSQQTNIVTTVTQGAQGTVTSISITLTPTGGGATTTFTVPPAGLPPAGAGTAGDTVPITPQGGGTPLTAVSNGDGTYNVELPDGTIATINPDGTPVQVNHLGGPGTVIEQFAFNRSDGFQSTQTGASAGGVDGKLAIWINGGYSTFDEDQTAIDSDGDTWSIAVGGDWQFSDRFIGGVSLAGSLSNVNTTFNDGDIETTGYTISPYFVTILGKNKNFLLDGAFGYTVNDNDAKRSFGAITSNYDSSSWFVSSNLTYIFSTGNFRVSPKVGVLWLDNTTDGYTESNGTVVPESGSKLGRASAGARLDYTKYAKFTPFISFTGEYDFETEDYSSFTGGNRPSVEDTGAVLGAGFSSQLSERLTGDVSGTTALGRDKYQAYTLSGTLRLSF